MLTFVRCMKEPTGSAAAPQPARENLETRIRAFVERAANASGRDDDVMITADSAEWYVEAALNFSNADLAQAHDNAEVDSLTYAIPLENGMVNESDAIAAYNALNPVVGASNVPDISHVVIVDVTSQNTADELSLIIAYVVGSGYEKELNTTYGPDDYWLWMSQSYSACEPNTQESPSGADKRIEKRIRQELLALGNTVYMVSIETWIVTAYYDGNNQVLPYYFFPAPLGPENNATGDWVNDFYSYACEPAGSSCVTCLDPDAMTHYTKSTWDLMEIIRAAECPDKLASNIRVQGEIFFPAPTEYFHHIDFRYGVIPK